MPPLSDLAVKEAVEITKAAVTPVGTACHHIGNAEAVATFIEVVAKKIHDLRTTNVTGPGAGH